MRRTFALGLAFSVGMATTAVSAPPREAEGPGVDATEAPASSFFDLFGYSMPEARTPSKASVEPGAGFLGEAALISRVNKPFTMTASETKTPCVTVPVSVSNPPSGVALISAEIVPTVADAFLKIDFTSSLNLNASGVDFDGKKRDGIALRCRLWRKTATATGVAVACPATGTYPFLISQISGYNGSARFWAGFIGQGSYTGLVDVTTLPTLAGWTAGTDSVVVDVQLMKAYNQGGTPAAPVPTSYGCATNLVLQTY
ncbi:MAG: hypothetical protein U0529_01835 [Thermoanaerobaculia bacterium]